MKGKYEEYLTVAYTKDIAMLRISFYFDPFVFYIFIMFFACSCRINNIQIIIQIYYGGLFD